MTHFDVRMPVTEGEDGKLLENKSKSQSTLFPHLKKVDNSCQNQTSIFSYLPKRKTTSNFDIKFKGLT